VLVDGRSVYTPLASTVFWESQDVPLVDIERIEVISGAGGTLWGANAVNGVINVITRSADATQGALVQGERDNHDGLLDVRYGAKLGESAAVRLYAHARRSDFGGTGPLGRRCGDQQRAGRLQGRRRRRARQLHPAGRRLPQQGRPS